MQELLEDFDKKNKAMATTRDKKEVSSPQTFKKKTSINPPQASEGRKYTGMIK